MHSFQTIFSLALLFTTSFASPIILDPGQSAATCGNNHYTSAQISSAVSTGCKFYHSGTGAGGSTYPHAFKDYEHIPMSSNGPWEEFPIMKKGDYNGGAPGADRVVFNSACQLSAVVTHTGFMETISRITQIEQELGNHRAAITKLESELSQLRATQDQQPQDHQPQHQKDTSNSSPNGSSTTNSKPDTHPPTTNPTQPKKYPLLHSEYTRYGRQLILPEISLHGHLKLKTSSVLLIGAGGLGCPAAIYLAGAGLGHIGIVDGDTVDESNLHRQILHGGNVGVNKAVSAVEAMRKLNPLVKYTAHEEALTAENAIDLVSGYDIVLDCSDNPATRYLVSDVCVASGKPLVSGAALRTDGQLLVLNAPPNIGPCYRCVFPVPPPADSVPTCGEAGVLGPVVGVMGVLQALEAIKVLVGQMPDRAEMLLFAGWGMGFRSIRMKGKRKTCVACGEGVERDALRERIGDGSVDYVRFCGGDGVADGLGELERVDARTYGKVVERGEKHLLVDVREKVQFELCAVEGSVNLPFSEIPGRVDGEQGERLRVQLEELMENTGSDTPLYVVCRLGNDSQVAVRRFQELGIDKERWIGDIRGGLRAWRRDVDVDFPDY
ncbi:hypothetical protein BT63DRAFT_418289 [Microthyrium microscopicum]|uniref:Adenylyltransferase and sulfurtransferase uba4 n=1 Tax=Microthyrium microscopicum TaxID=703497 RepID=A0A6A6TVS8_9PEZI|nr:hypothetical protein BT63DRAFT_418289 [Microthyrium microscopicum]